MANTITPMETNLAASGKTVTVGGSLDFDMGDPSNSSDRTPLINLLMSELAFDQMIPFALDLEAAQVDVNLWEAPSEDLRARVVVLYCDYGGGAIIINGDGDPIPVPLAAEGFLMYANKADGPTVDVGGSPTATKLGINKITVSTENETRIRGYVFV